MCSRTTDREVKLSGAGGHRRHALGCLHLFVAVRFALAWLWSVDSWGSNSWPVCRQIRDRLGEPYLQAPSS